MTNNTRTLIDNEKYRVVLTERQAASHEYSNKLLVGFGEIGAGLDSAGFGNALAEKLGISYATVNQAKRTQYQHLSREVLTEVLSPLKNDYDLYFYGTSLGGYAAAYYSRPLGANFLALSPRLPVHPITDRRIPIRFKSEGFLHQGMHEGYASREPSRKVVLFDQHNSVDSFYVNTELKSAFSDLETHHVPNAGHYVPRVLLLSGMLKRVVLDFLQGNEFSIVLKDQEVINWHRDRFYLNLSKRRIGHATEHLEVLLRHDSPEHIMKYTHDLAEAISVK